MDRHQPDSHRSHRWSAASLLQIDEAYLWPQIVDEKRGVDVSRAECVALYPTRGAVSPGLWLDLVEAAQVRIDILACSCQIATPI